MTAQTHNLPRLLAIGTLMGFGLTSLNLTTTRLVAQSKPCVSMNWTVKPYLLLGGTSYDIRAKSGPNALAFDGIEFYTYRFWGTGSIRVSIWDAKGPMRSGTRLATGTASIGMSLQNYKATFSKSAVITANAYY